MSDVVAAIDPSKDALEISKHAPDWVKALQKHAKYIRETAGAFAIILGAGVAILRGLQSGFREVANMSFSSEA